MFLVDTSLINFHGPPDLKAYLERSFGARLRQCGIGPTTFLEEMATHVYGGDRLEGS
jgi:hypothetical protein